MKKRSANPKRFLSPEETALVEQSVRDGEQNTSAEIKTVIVSHCWCDIRDKAEHVFLKNKLHETADRNCVMIMIVTTNREFLIYGDLGIHKKVGQEFWNEVRDGIAGHFKEDRFGEGISEGVKLVGQKLQQHFPVKTNDKNEISDEVIVEN